MIEEEALKENAEEVGAYYKNGLKGLQKKYKCIGDIRGSGLFLGFKIVFENTTKPNTDLAANIKNRMRNRGILISTEGPCNNVLKTKPPLCFTKENVDAVIHALGAILLS